MQYWFRSLLESENIKALFPQTLVLEPKEVILNVRLSFTT